MSVQGRSLSLATRAGNIGKGVNVDEVLGLRDQGVQGVHPVLARLLKQHGFVLPV
jgi:hypothetical protein